MISRVLLKLIGEVSKDGTSVLVSWKELLNLVSKVRIKGELGVDKGLFISIEIGAGDKVQEIMELGLLSQGRLRGWPCHSRKVEESINIAVFLASTISDCYLW